MELEKTEDRVCIVCKNQNTTAGVCHFLTCCTSSAFVALYGGGAFLNARGLVG